MRGPRYSIVTNRRPFEANPTDGLHRLVAGTRFSNMPAIGNFDRQLRLLAIDAIDAIERIGALIALLNARPTGDLAAMGFPADWTTRPLWT